MSGYQESLARTEHQLHIHQLGSLMRQHGFKCSVNAEGLAVEIPSKTKRGADYIDTVTIKSFSEAMKILA